MGPLCFCWWKFLGGGCSIPKTTREPWSTRQPARPATLSTRCNATIDHQSAKAPPRRAILIAVHREPHCSTMTLFEIGTKVEVLSFDEGFEWSRSEARVAVRVLPSVMLITLAAVETKKEMSSC